MDFQRTLVTAVARCEPQTTSRPGYSTSFEPTELVPRARRILPASRSGSAFCGRAWGRHVAMWEASGALQQVLGKSWSRKPGASLRLRLASANVACCSYCNSPRYIVQERKAWTGTQRPTCLALLGACQGPLVPPQIVHSVSLSHRLTSAGCSFYVFNDPQFVLPFPSNSSSLAEGLSLATVRVRQVFPPQNHSEFSPSATTRHR